MQFITFVQASNSQYIDDREVMTFNKTSATECFYIKSLFVRVLMMSINQLINQTAGNLTYLSV